MITAIVDRILLAAAWLVALFIGGKQAADAVLSLSDSESPRYDVTRTRDNPALEANGTHGPTSQMHGPHSNTIEGS